MSSWKRRIALAAGVLAAAAMMLVLYRELTRPVILEFGMFVGSNWGVANANSYVIIDRAIERFEKEHPGVKVHYTSGILKDDYSEWFSRKLLSGKTPDIFMMLSSDFDRFCSLGAVSNLEDLMAADPDFQKDAYFTSALNLGKYDRNQYALPYEIVPTLMFVNRSLLLSEGIQVPREDWTWNDLYRISKKITKDSDGNGSLDRFGTFNYNWRDVVITNGTSLFDNDGKQTNFTDPRVVDAIKFSKSIYDLNQGQKVTQEDFDNGSVAFMPLSFAEYRTYKTYPYKIKKYTSFQWNCITMPAGNQGGNLSEVDALLMGISSHTKHKRLAWEFLKLLTYDTESQMDIFRYSQGASVIKSVVSSQEVDAILQEDMDAGERIIDNELLSRVIEEGVIAPRFQNYDAAMAFAENEVSKIMETDKSIDRTLKLIQRTIPTYLSE